MSRQRMLWAIMNGKKPVISIDAGMEIDEVTKAIFAKLDAVKIN